jgi:ubiquinone/menaquinone biosynthesis C-methylase UbiE
VPALGLGLPTMKRIVVAELLDTVPATPAQITVALADLRTINRWFGGVGATQSMIVQVAEKLGASSLSLLEVAAGAGYVPQAVSKSLRARGIRLEVTLLDRAHAHLKNSNGNGTSAVAGDALALPFAYGSVDLVSCCLFTHHLEPEEVVQFVNEGLRVCRAAVIINDLIRDPIHLALAYASLPLYRSRFTYHDAPASVRRAYTMAQMRAMLQQSAAAKVQIDRCPFFRMAAIAWKR